MGMGIKELGLGLALIILFGILAFTFMFSFIQQNNPDGFVDSKNLNASKQDFIERTNNLETLENVTKKLISEAKPSPTFLFLIIISAFEIPFAFLQFLFGGLGSILTLLFTSIGARGDGTLAIVFLVIGLCISLVIILTVLKAIRSGQVDT